MLLRRYAGKLVAFEDAELQIGVPEQMMDASGMISAGGCAHMGTERASALDTDDPCKFLTTLGGRGPVLPAQRAPPAAP